MNCEQVGELLSAYLDDSLAVGETAESAFQLKVDIASHLRDCVLCSTMLADFRRLDNLLASMPHVSPSAALRDKIFSSPEYLALTGTTDSTSAAGTYDTQYSSRERELTGPHNRTKSTRRDTPGRPQLVALPGGRSVSAQTSPNPALRPSTPVPQSPRTRRKGTWGLVIMQATIAAALLLTLGVGSLIAWNIWSQGNSTAKNIHSITPPVSAPQQGSGPLSAGMRFVFLRNGVLWSTPADGTTSAHQLTPEHVTVAANWVVSSPLPGRYAGDMLAYIDLQQARLHTLRSDGLRDTVISLPLLKAGITPSSVWDTDIGANILNSLAWSQDGSMLAFVADPTDADLTSLYIYSQDSGTVQMVPLPIKGSVSHPVWSPDGVRVAFALTHNNIVSILDYNTQNHGILLITNSTNTQGAPNDSLLSLNWSPDTAIPAITWSVGVVGHVHSIWLRHVGVGGNANPQELLQGDYAQAIYSINGHNGVGSWLLVASTAGRATNLWREDAVQGTLPVILTSSKQVNFARWSPDGSQIDYLDSISLGVGAFHVVNVATLTDTFIASSVADTPAPAWSNTGQQLVYSTGTQTVVVDLQKGKKLYTLALQGLASTYTWSADSSNQLVLALGDGQPGIYLVDTQRHTTHQIDPEATDGPILWTEIP